MMTKFDYLFQLFYTGVQDIRMLIG